MNVEERVRLAIGDLTVQLHAAAARIEQLEKELKESVDLNCRVKDPE